MTSIWWVRRDLRLTDNPALREAMVNGPVIPVFIFDPILLASPYVGEKRLAFLLAGLHQLDADLRARGSRLIIRRGDPVEQLVTLMAETGAQMIYAGADVSPYARRRDARVAARLPLTLLAGPAVRAPWEVRKADGALYTKFTPFSKAWKALPLPCREDLLPAPAWLGSPGNLNSLSIPGDPALPSSVPFVAGEAEALRRLEAFLCRGIVKYAENRNYLDLEGTSALSPYLRFGMLSARQAVVAALEAIAAAPDEKMRNGPQVWLNELIWREFYLMILYHFPRVCRESLRADLRNVPWNNGQADFAAWQTGHTGYPVVDAAMRQLVQTGWIHNRARMIAASFLTKDLLIDWRWGERFFMQYLVDGDLAANNGGWQWTAGTGTDAAPYFRVFNPVVQGQKFDPGGIYVRRWLPELAHVPDEYVHQPWAMPPDIQQAAGCVIGQDYPFPIIIHAWARQRVLMAYQVAQAKG